MKTDSSSDEKFMRAALDEALAAREIGEVPIGAVVVADGRIVGRGHNMVETLGDATAHAELLAITAASQTLGGKYLDTCELFVTLEPCTMCAGACAWSHVGRIVYGAADPKRGYSRHGGGVLHPRTEVRGGVLERECGELLTGFFRERR